MEWARHRPVSLAPPSRSHKRPHRPWHQAVGGVRGRRQRAGGRAKWASVAAVRNAKALRFCCRQVSIPLSMVSAHRLPWAFVDPRLQPGSLRQPQTDDGPGLPGLASDDFFRDFQNHKVFHATPTRSSAVKRTVRSSSHDPTCVKDSIVHSESRETCDAFPDCVDSRQGWLYLTLPHGRPIIPLTAGRDITDRPP
jgi:hypothetical protein